jgi:hypothetical protein
MNCISSNVNGVPSDRLLFSLLAAGMPCRNNRGAPGWRQLPCLTLHRLWHRYLIAVGVACGAGCTFTRLAPALAAPNGWIRESPVGNTRR